MAAHRCARVGVVALDHGSDIGKRKTKLLQRDDPVQPPHVCVGVDPMTGLGSLRWPQQLDLVVVVQRADR
jgi:hypothetical protein